MRALAIAATGMDAQQTNLEVIANNIANINTTGYKRARAEFADALQINHHAQGADHKAQISGHGLGAGQKLQGHFVNFVFEGIYGCVIFYDRCGPAGVARCHGLAGVFKGNAHAGAHDQQSGTQ